MVRVMSRRSERGAVIVLLAPLLAVIFAVTALAIDMGNARQESRHAQASADAAALAAARELPVMAPVDGTPFVRVRQRAAEFAGTNVDGSPTAFTATTCSAELSASAKCYLADDTTLTVITPYNPGIASAPKSYNLVYVKICQPTTTFFSQVIGASSPTVCREAVGRRQNITGGYGMGLVVINDTECDSLIFAGDSGTVLSSNGAVMVNSECPYSALSASGTSWELTTEYIGVVGGADLAPCNPPYSCSSSIPESGIDHFPDPFAHITPPDPSSIGTSPTNACANAGSQVLMPGRYTAQCKKTSGELILRPGVYYFDAGFSSTGGNIICDSTVTTVPPVGTYTPDCSGVTLIIGGGSFTLAGNGWVHLPPPTTGTYAGISVYQVSSSDSKINGTADFLLGTIYAPNAYYEFTGSGGGAEVNIEGMVVTDTAKISGTFEFNINVPEEAPEALPEDDFGLWK